jgi:cathepsin A (carboxypeptidase C)
VKLLSLTHYTNIQKGGHYAPAIAHRIWVGNNDAAESTIHLNLAGLGLGNGLTKPEEQYKWYPDMVYNNSHGIKVVSETTYETMKEVVPKCTSLIHECNQGDGAVNTFACQSAFLVCNMGLTSPYQMTGLNPYDIRKKCEVPPLCYDFSHITSWVNSKETKEALHVDEKHSHNWASCNMEINLRFHTDWMKDFSPFVVDLLHAGIHTIVYAGDVDFICTFWKYFSPIL